MHISVPNNKVLFSILYFLPNKSEVDFGNAHVTIKTCKLGFALAYIPSVNFCK